MIVFIANTLFLDLKQFKKEDPEYKSAGKDKDAKGFKDGDKNVVVDMAPVITPFNYFK